MSKPVNTIANASVVSAGLYILFGHPITYRLTNLILNPFDNSALATIDKLGNPTVFGTFLHGVLYGLAMWGMSERYYKVTKYNIVTGIVAALLFFVISMPQTYYYINDITHLGIINDEGQITTIGVLIHSVVMGVVVAIILAGKMYFNK